jgi:chromosome segregation ATPase
LTFKNRQFKKNHAVVKAQLDEKVEEVKALKQQDEQRAESFLCINRLWEQLNDELAHLAARLDVQLDQQEPSDAEVAEVTAAAQAISDPYLRRLLVGDPSSIKAVKKAYGTLQGGLSDAEKALIERSKATAEAFARVLDAVQQQSRYSSSLAAQIAGSEADAALKEENQRLSAEVARLQQQLDGSHAKALSTSQLLKDRESQLKIAEELRLAANNELAGKESQYNLLRGKLEELQHKVKEAEAEAAAAKAAAATAAPRPGSPAAVDAGLSSGAAGPGAAAAESADAAAALAPDIQEQLADLQRLCDKRAADLEAERVEHVKTKQ